MMQHKHMFGVAIASQLNSNDLSDVTQFEHVNVLDLRFCGGNIAQPIEETVLKRLQNIRVSYEQKPLDLKSASSRQENELFQTLCDQSGSTLILTGQIAAMAKFCMELNVSYVSKELYLVETGAETVPVQLERDAVQPIASAKLPPDDGPELPLMQPCL